MFRIRPTSKSEGHARITYIYPHCSVSVKRCQPFKDHMSLPVEGMMICVNRLFSQFLLCSSIIDLLFIFSFSVL